MQTILSDRLPAFSPEPEKQAEGVRFPAINVHKAPPVDSRSPFESFDQFLSGPLSRDCIASCSVRPGTRVLSLLVAHTPEMVPQILDRLHTAIGICRPRLQRLEVLCEIVGLTDHERPQANTEITEYINGARDEGQAQARRETEFGQALIVGLRKTSADFKLPIAFKYTDVGDADFLANYIDESTAAEELDDYLSSNKADPTGFVFYGVTPNKLTESASGKASTRERLEDDDEPLSTNWPDALEYTICSSVKAKASPAKAERNLCMAVDIEIGARNAEPGTLVVSITGAAHAAASYAQYLNPYVGGVSHEYVLMPEHLLQAAPARFRYQMLNSKFIEMMKIASHGDADQINWKNIAVEAVLLQAVIRARSATGDKILGSFDDPFVWHALAFELRQQMAPEIQELLLDPRKAKGFSLSTHGNSTMIQLATAIAGQWLSTKAPDLSSAVSARDFYASLLDFISRDMQQ